MTDAELRGLLAFAAPRLRLRPAGFRRVREQVRKRIARRIRELELGGAADYRALLEQDDAEWAVLDGLCRVTISRFQRDRRVFEVLRDELLPALLAGRTAGPSPFLRVLSAGCASGEEPYTVALLVHLALAPRFPGLALELLALDADQALLERARRGCYRPGTLRELPPDWVARGFTAAGDELCLRPELRQGVHFRRADLRQGPPAGPWDLILCRNLAFSYFAPALQEEVLAGLLGQLRRGGLLVIGAHEALPVAPAQVALEPASGALPIFRRT